MDYSVSDAKHDLTNSIIFAENSWVTSGGYADIHRGWYNGQTVAVKVIREARVSNRKISTNLERERRLWSSMHHENIIPFLGICFYPGDNRIQGDLIFSLVSPWMENGTIHDFLKRERTSNRIDLLRGVLTGLTYLHSQNIIHGDLKGGNILVSNEGNAMLADFGLAQMVATDPTLTYMMSTSSTLTNLGGTVNWMAPELFEEMESIPKLT
ncbi:kinase-like protein [Sistotremastrum niveocremeum HHB9708]|uniref:Kinase-like protein n=1 Tax=Sistotremastrum niveocremeum HHB9708 TaxID=1314777 RepID=A0A164P122_9AGAM|nr:kinase-like protein [Sistotremastrum niveocremeum HHB9708]